MTNKQIEHLISNWENARLDPMLVCLVVIG